MIEMLIRLMEASAAFLRALAELLRIILKR